MTNLDRSRIMLSVQRALLGAITPQIRAVDVSWNDSEIILRFSVDTLDDFDDDIANEVEAEVQGEVFPLPRVTSEVAHISTGSAIPAFDRLRGGSARAFARRE